MNIYDEKIADRIRECAKKVGSGNELTRLTGIKRRTLEDYMTGTSEPKASALYAIAKAAKVSLDWLIAGEGEADKTASHVTFALDMEALEAAIKLVERIAKQNGINLVPEKKASVVSIIYEEIADSPSENYESKIDMTNIVRLVKLAG